MDLDAPPPEAPPEPVRPEPSRCAPASRVSPLATFADVWVRQMAPLVGCPERSLERPEWNLAVREFGESVRETDEDGLQRIRVSSTDGETDASATIRDGEVVRVSHVQRPGDRQRVVSLFRLNASLLSSELWATPDTEAEHQVIYGATAQRPFAVHYYRTDDALVLDVLSPDEAIASPPETMAAPEAGTRAASGAECDSELRMGLLDWKLLHFKGLADRLGCDFEPALADLELTDPIETLTNPDGSVLVQTFARPGTGFTVRDLDQHVLVQHMNGKLASIAYLWRSNPDSAWRQARVTGAALYGEPDMSIPGQMSWFDGAERPYGVSLMRTEQGVLFQLIDSRWF